MSTIRELREFGRESLKEIYKKPNFLDSNNLFLDVDLLLREACNFTEVSLISSLNILASQSQIDVFHELIERRKKAEPIAYILQRKEFYSRDFFVDESVLIPRPETEELVEIVLSHIDKLSLKGIKHLHIIDIGTGSGAIVITLLLELASKIYPFKSYFYANDISNSALEVARENAKKHGVKDSILFLEGDLIKPYLSKDIFVKPNVSKEESYFLFISNPPYVETDAELSFEVGNYEPALALFADSDGMSVINQLLGQFIEFGLNSNLAYPQKAENTALFLEIGANQLASVESSPFVPKDKKLSFYRDYSEKIRFVSFV